MTIRLYSCILTLICFVFMQHVSSQNQVKIDVINQEIPRNAKTDMVSIMDSISMPLENAKDVKEVINEWEKYLSVPDNLKELYKSKDQYEYYFLYRMGLSNAIDKNTSNTSWKMTYSNVKVGRLTGGITETSKSNGTVSFKIKYIISKKGVNIEFTDFEYDGTRFEEEAYKPTGVYGVLPALSKNKSLWREIKMDYLVKIRKLSDHFKNYTENYFAKVNSSSADDFSNSKISYDTYKKIQSGMNYETVIKLLGDEGRELSYNLIKKDSREVSEQIIVWYSSDDSRDKYIKLTFIDRVVTSKSQANL